MRSGNSDAGASGIGYALGLQLVHAGARVALADIDHQAVLARAEELNRAGGSQVAVAHHLDVRDEAAIRGVVVAVWADGPLDLPFNNAGIVLGGAHEPCGPVPPVAGTRRVDMATAGLTWCASWRGLELGDQC